jgi:hypothetical protein
MKSTRKHELQTNELADALAHLFERAKPHAQVIGYGVLAVLVLILIVVVLPTFRSSAAGRNPAADAFAEAQASGQIQPVRDFLKDYPEAPQVPAARLLLADRDLAEVVRGIRAAPGEDVKAKAASLLAEAKDLYTQVAASSSPVMEPLARAGLAMTTIQEGDVEKGRAALQTVLERWPNTIGAEKAKANIAALASYKPVEFSSEPVEEEKPPAAATGAPGIAPQKPKTEGIDKTDIPRTQGPKPRP